LTARPEKKKKKEEEEQKLCNSKLVAAADKWPPKPSGGPPRDHFKKMLEAPCPYHEASLKHVLKDCNLMTNFFSGAPKNKPLDASKIDAAKNADNADFPKEVGDVMMIFSGTLACLPRHKYKRILQEIYHVEPIVCSYLRWFETAITYDRTDHPNHIPQPGAYPLVVAPLFGTKRVHKVLMDGGAASTSSICTPSTTWGFHGLGCDRHQCHSTGSYLGWRRSCSGRSTYLSPSVT
jgi:hypothetical protein